MRHIAIGLITFYQRALSPYFPGVCRHTPSCSHYAKEAIERYGVLRGGWMGAKRISRCRPLGTRGYDPVPQDCNGTIDQGLTGPEVCSAPVKGLEIADAPGESKVPLVTPSSARLGQGALLLLVTLLSTMVLAACVGNRFAPSAGWSGVADGGSDLVYLGSRDGQVLALEAATGRRFSAFPLEEDREFFGAIYGTPTVTEDRVYVGGFNGKVYALDKEDLEPVKPAFEVEGEELSKGVIGAVIVSGSKAVFGAAEDADTGRLYVLDAQELVEVCTFPTRGNPPIGKIWSTPLVSAGVAYFGDMDHFFYAVSTDDCSLQWPQPLDLDGGVGSTPFLLDGAIYVGAFDRGFYAINAATGEARRLFKGGSWFWSGIATDGDLLFVPNLDGALYAVEPSTGSIAWQFDTEGSILSAPVLAGGYVVVASDAETLYALDPQNGLVEWQRQLDDRVRAPLMARGSVVYLSMMNHTVHAIDIAQRQAFWNQPTSTK